MFTRISSLIYFGFGLFAFVNGKLASIPHDFIVPPLRSELQNIKQAEILSCGQPDNDRIHNFYIRADSPVGPINYLTVHYDPVRKLPIAVTALHDSLNQIKNVEREDNFRMMDCPELIADQMDCKNTFRMTVEQQEKSNRTSWDRGHLVPVAPFRFSFESMDKTFYCVNIGPQDPYTNQQPWNFIEQKTHARLAEHPAFVMTGVCSADNTIDGPTLLNYTVPACWWKLLCYKDPLKNGAVQVVGFIGNNTIIHYSQPGPDRTERDLSTKKPRHQQDILDLMTRESDIFRAWEYSAYYLLHERSSVKPDELPTAQQCINALHMDKSTEREWQLFISNTTDIPSGCRRFLSSTFSIVLLLLLIGVMYI